MMSVHNTNSRKHHGLACGPGKLASSGRDVFNGSSVQPADADVAVVRVNRIAPNPLR